MLKNLVFLTVLFHTGNCFGQMPSTWVVLDASKGDTKLWHMVGSQIGITKSQVQIIGAGVNPQISLARILSQDRQANSVSLSFSTSNPEDTTQVLELKRNGNETSATVSSGDSGEKGIAVVLELRPMKSAEFNWRFEYFNKVRNNEIANRAFDKLLNKPDNQDSL